MEVLSRKKKRESHTMILLALEFEWDLKAANPGHLHKKAQSFCRSLALSFLFDSKFELGRQTFRLKLNGHSAPPCSYHIRILFLDFKIPRLFATDNEHESESGLKWGTVVTFILKSATLLSSHISLLKGCLILKK